MCCVVDEKKAAVENDIQWKSAVFDLGTLSPNPWDFSLSARMALGGAAHRRPSFRLLDSALVASLRCHILRPGKVSIDRIATKILAREDQTALQKGCPEPVHLAGFEVIMPGRFWGDHRGPSAQ